MQLVAELKDGRQQLADKDFTVQRLLHRLKQLRQQLREQERQMQQLQMQQQTVERAIQQSDRQSPLSARGSPPKQEQSLVNASSPAAPLPAPQREDRKTFQPEANVRTREGRGRFADAKRNRTALTESRQSGDGDRFAREHDAGQLEALPARPVGRPIGPPPSRHVARRKDLGTDMDKKPGESPLAVSEPKVQGQRDRGMLPQVPAPNVESGNEGSRPHHPGDEPSSKQQSDVNQMPQTHDKIPPKSDDDRRSESESQNRPVLPNDNSTSSVAGRSLRRRSPVGRRSSYGSEDGKPPQGNREWRELRKPQGYSEQKIQSGEHMAEAKDEDTGEQGLEFRQPVRSGRRSKTAGASDALDTGKSIRMTSNRTEPLSGEKTSSGSLRGAAKSGTESDLNTTKSGNVSDVNAGKIIAPLPDDVNISKANSTAESADGKPSGGILERIQHKLNSMFVASGASTANTTSVILTEKNPSDSRAAGDNGNSIAGVGSKDLAKLNKTGSDDGGTVGDSGDSEKVNSSKNFPRPDQIQRADAGEDEDLDGKPGGGQAMELQQKPRPSAENRPRTRSDATLEYPSSQNKQQQIPDGDGGDGEGRRSRVQLSVSLTEMMMMI